VPALVLLAFALRAVWPLADPARRISWSSGVYTDPATVAHSARNAILFGEWARDESRDLVFYPLFNWITWLAYQGLGPSRLTTQLLAALLGAATVAAIAWATSRAIGRRGSVVAAALVATCYWLVMFGRVPVVENAVALLLVVAAALALGRSERSRFAAGLVAGVAVLFGKLHAISFLPALVVFLLARDRRVRVLAAPGLGLGVAVAAWAFLIFRPFRAELLEQVRAAPLYGEVPFLRSPLEGVAEFLRAIQRSWLFVRMPVLGSLGVAFVLGTLAHAELRRDRLEKGGAIFAFWFASAWIYHSLLPYQAPRYYLPAAVALVAGAACLLDEFAKARGLPRRRPRGAAEIVAWATGLLGAGLATVVTCSHGLWVLRDLTVASASSAVQAVRTFLGEIAWSLNPFPAVLVVGGSLGVGLAVIAARAFPLRLGQPAAARLAARLLGLALVINGVQFLWWAGHRTYALEDAKASLDAVVGEDAVLFGAMAPALVQDSDRIGIPQFGDVVNRLPPEVTHVADLGDPGSSTVFAADLRDDMVLVRRWPLRSHFLRFVGVVRVSNDDYQPTFLEQAVEHLARDRPHEALELVAQHRATVASESHDLLQIEARAWFRAGEMTRARQGLQRAMALRPTIPTDHHNLGRLLEREGDRAGAVALWRRGLALDPDDPDLLHALGLDETAR
jgi:4-amino-4-deoxy-L-arabinose transferase-like glycosyltransferase